MIYHGHDYQLDDLPDTVNTSVNKLMPHRHRFDFIVTQGMSGVLVAAPVSVEISKPLAVVRKEGEQCHGGFDVLGYKSVVGRYLFLDDFISTGKTFLRICKRMHNWPDDHIGYEGMPKEKPAYAGSYLYGDCEFSWCGDGGWMDDMYKEVFQNEPEPEPEQPSFIKTEVAFPSPQITAIEKFEDDIRAYRERKWGVGA